MPVSRNAHHAQLAATPPWRTRSVTRFGVSVLKVVATIDTPISHHGAARPDVKNSAVLDPARRASHTAGANEIASETTTMIQSSEVSCIGYTPTRSSFGLVRQRPRVKSGTSIVRARLVVDCMLSSTTALSEAAS